MKKDVLIFFGLILIIIISGCSLIPELNEPAAEVNLEEKGELGKVEEELIGPGGCKGDECTEYCKRNQTGCLEWCQENPQLCEKMLVEIEGHEEISTDFPDFGINPQECYKDPQKCIEFCEKNPGICPEEHLKNLKSGMEGVVGPGGCMGSDCATVCSTQPEVCQEWCEKNPQMCAMFMGGGPEGFETVEPPAITITFAKTVNLNADQFTEQDISKAKDLGANMLTIWPSRMIKNDEFIFSWPERLVPMINFAHKNGLQVELRSSFGGEQITNYNKFRANAIKHVVEFAKFAEKNRVYRIVPFGEIDNNLINHCEKITVLSKELLQEMRKYYYGQIGTGVAASWRDCGFNFEGYDYLTVSIYPQTQTGMDDWLTNEPEINLNSVIDWARTVADRSNIDVLHIGETGVNNIGEKDPSGFFQTVEVSKEKEAEFYQKVFSLISTEVNGVSVFYNSRSIFMGINGDPAEEVVKEWYNKIGSGVERNEDTKLIVANPLNLSQIARISKFRSCYGHDYSGLNIEGERETLRSMKHYIEFFTRFLGSENRVKVFAPFDGKITEILEAGGKQVFISADATPSWHFIFFHTSLEPNIKVGAAVKAGQLVGYAYVSEWPTFDFALKEFSRRAEIFESPFLHMQDFILEEYASYGITPENIIISKQFRDTHPCPIRGIIDGEEAFTGETENEDFVVLK